MASTQPLIFQGIDGAECEEFIASLLQRAFDDGKIRDPQYIADIAATCFRGDALRWYLGLDDDVHADWRRLRQAMIAQYPHPSRRASEVMAPSTIPTPAAAPPARPFLRHLAGAPSQFGEGELIAPSNVDVSSIPQPIGPTSDEVPANFDYRNRRGLSRSSTQSNSSRGSLRPSKNPPAEGEDDQFSDEDQYGLNLTSLASEDLDNFTRNSFGRDLISQPSAAWSVTPQDEPPVSYSLLAEPKQIPTRLRRSSSTASLIADALPVPPSPTASISTTPPPQVDSSPSSPIADRPLLKPIERPTPALGATPRTMTGRIRVVTHGEQADRGYVTRTRSIMKTNSSSSLELSSIMVGADAALYELSTSPNRQSLELQNATWSRSLAAIGRDGGYLGTRGVALLTIGPVQPGPEKGTYVYREMWKLRDLRIVPELPQSTARNAEWREVSLVLGHDKSARLSPVLILVPSESITEFSGKTPFTTRWEHVDLLFEVSES